MHKYKMELMKLDQKLGNIISNDKKYYMNTFGDRLPVCFEYGKGVNLFSTDGKKYYDFMAGIAVNSLGYGNKRIEEAICNQVKKVIHTSSLYYVESQAQLAYELCENSFADKAFFSNSGAEANEGAIKLVRKYFYAKNEDKYQIITLKKSFHGRTLATVSATGQEKYQKPFAPLVSEFIHVEKNSIEELKKAITPNTGAIMLELIQGESGVVPLDKEYVKEIRKICDENDIVLIIDEIQTGIGRTGKLFCYENYEIEPDIMTLAKALGAGVPIGAVLAKDKFCAFTPGDHGTTFGGNPLATTAALAVLSEMKNHGVLENCCEVGSYLKDKLNVVKEKTGKIKEVRGMGLMIGIEFYEDNAGEMSKKLFDKGFLVGVVGTNVFRLVPPLIVKKEEADLLVFEIEKILEEN